MKHLIYLDKDFLYSYYAQAFDGIDNSHTLETKDETQTAEEDVDGKVSAGAKVEVKIPAFASLNGSLGSESGYLRSQYIETEAAREAITVSLHDNALDRVIKHSEPKKADNIEINKFTIVKGKFILYDLSTFIALLEKDTIEFMAEKQWEEFVKKQPNPGAPQLQNGKKAFIGNKMSELKETKQQMEMLQKFSQVDVCLIVESFIIPLRREYMKENSQEINFKYNSDIAVYGQVTRFNSESPREAATDVLSTLTGLLNNMMPQALQRLGILKDFNYKVINPMAVYFE